jgi:hypothetical protein
MPNTPALIIACYGLFVLALGDALARGPFARFCQGPVERRICTIATLLVLGLLPALGSLFAEGETQRILLAFSPFTGPVELFSRSHTPSSSPGGWIALGMGLVGFAWLWHRALGRSVRLMHMTANESDEHARS